MNKTDNQLIDEALLLYNDKSRSIDLQGLLERRKDLDSPDIHRILDRMEYLGYIEMKGLYHKITGYGQDVIAGGGHQMKEERDMIERIKEQERKRLEDKKLQNEFILSKWQVKLFWIVFAITVISSLAGLVISIIALNTSS